MPDKGGIPRDHRSVDAELLRRDVKDHGRKPHIDHG